VEGLTVTTNVSNQFRDLSIGGEANPGSIGRIIPADKTRSLRPTRKASKARSMLIASAAALAGLLGSAANSVFGSLITLQNGNSSFSVNSYNDNAALQDGAYNWTVDGINQLKQQWFWFRIGNSGPGIRLNDPTVMAAPTTTLIDTDGDGKFDYASLTYQAKSGAFKVVLSYLLTGGNTGSGVSDVASTVKVTNLTSSPLDMHFLHYSDLDLGNTPNNDSVAITGGNTAHQTDAQMNVNETVGSPRPDEYAAGPSPTLRNSLDSGAGIPLGDTPTDTNNNASWAFEWDRNLAAGQSLVISTDSQTNLVNSIPEPTSAAAIIGTGSLFLIRPRRRDQEPDVRMQHVVGA
jgi:hypothetical protein